MEETILKDIITLCWRMDEHAIKIYYNLSQTADPVELKKFWKQMSEEESQHVTFWKDLLVLAEEKVIPQIFRHPETTLGELKKNYNKVIELSRQSAQSTDLTDNFLLAFRLEFYLLHPALEQLWHFYRLILDEKHNPELEYENHIRGFIDAMQKFGADSVGLEALGETIERMWSNAKNMAKETNLDDLTRILNRRGLFNVMTSLASLAKRNAFYSGLLMVDIDHFKRVNDTMGHQAGDTVLKDVSAIIKSNLRTSDIVGRFGGEEFLVFLPDIKKENIYFLAEKIRRAIQEETSKAVPVTASIGGTGTTIKGVVEKEIHELIKQADSFLYEAKRKGPNQVIC